MISIAIADDHRLIRQGLVALLDHEADFAVLAEAADGPETLRMVEAMHPDVLVLDIKMPGLDGLAVAHQVRQRTPGTQVVFLTMHDAESYIYQALQSGAVGYVLKEASVTELTQAIRKAAQGKRYLSARLAESAFDAYAHYADASAIEPYQTLTPREREVLLLTAEGLTAAQVAAHLFISPRTVEAHRGNVMRKLGLSKKAALVRYAFQRGLLPLKKAA